MSDTLLLNSLNGWLRNYLKSNLDIDEMDKTQKIPKNFIIDAGAKGLFGMQIPCSLGGIALSLNDALVVIEQLAASNITLAAFLVLQHTCSHAILANATAQFKERFLSQMASGKMMGCFALSEPDAGSNPRAMSTYVTPSAGEKWHIRGTKCWVGGAELAGMFIVFASHLSGKYKGISCFAIPSTTPGIEIGPVVEGLGVRALNLCTITLHNVEVGDENLLGEYGKGMIVAESVLMRGRLFSSALSAGIKKKCAQMMFRYASQRKVGTGLLLENPVTVALLAELNYAIISTGALRKIVSLELDEDRKVPSAVLMACKIASSELAWKATDQLVQLMGARGLDEHNVACQMLRDSRFLRIGEGPTETLLMELGAILDSKDSSLLQFIKNRLVAEKTYKALLDTIDKIQKTTSCSSEHPINHTQWQYFNLGKLGVWALLEASLEYALRNEADPMIQEALVWVQQKFNQELDICRLAQMQSPSWNLLRKVVDRIEFYDHIIGHLDDLPIKLDELSKPGGIDQAIQNQSVNTTILTIYETQLELTPDGIALISPHESLTYLQLDKKVNQLAFIFNGYGIKPGDVIGICMGRTTCFIASLLAILKIGATILPLNIRHPKERNNVIISAANAKIMLTEESLCHLLPNNYIKQLCVDTIQTLNDTPAKFESLATSDTIAYIIFTSGSTGSPKGVMVSHRAICELLVCRRDTFNMRPDDRVLYLSVPNFDIAIWEFFGAFAAGASIALSGDNTFTWDPKNTAELIYRYKVTHIQISPTQLNLLLLSGPDIASLCSTLRYVFSGGETLSKQVQKLFFDTLSAELIAVYGSTEAVLDVTYWCCTPDKSYPVGYIGHHFPNKRVYVLDTDLKPTPVGVPGEIYIGGYIAEGYLDQPELTEEHFLVDPFVDNMTARMYRSGDCARFLSNGALEFLGRFDQQIKINGLRIEPGEIEAILETHPEIKQLRVVAKKNRQSGLSSILVAYYLSDSNHSSCEKSLRELARNRLPKEMIPSIFVHLDTFPLTSTGKLDLKALPDIDSLTASSSQGLDTTDPTSQVVLSIWEELLTRIVQEETTDFFELGGHSLIAVQMLTRIREELAIEIPLSDFFDNPTLQGLIEKIKCARVSGEELENQDPITTSRDTLTTLSGTQENLWYLYQLNPESSAYNCPEAIRLQGHLNIEKLELALRIMFKRHESLRTVFTLQDGKPMQMLLPEEDFNLDVIDFSTLSIDKREQALVEAIKTESSRTFLLYKENPFKSCVFKMAEEDHVFFWNFHHIIADGWSLARVFTTELGELYSAQMEKRQFRLHNLDIQPVDYMRWQKKYLSHRINKQREFWKKELDGAPSEIDLSLGYSQLAKPSEHGHRVFLNITDELFVSLQGFCQKENFTLFELLMTAFSSLAHIFSGEDEIVIGTVVAGRKHSSIEHVIGNFANVVVVRNDLHGDPTLYALMDRLRRKMVDIIDNSDIPFDEVVSAVQPNRNRYKNPLFNIFLSLYNGSLNDLRLTGLQSTVYHCDQEAAQFDLSLAFFEAKSSLEGYIEYKIDLFNGEAVKRIADYYVKVLHTIINNSQFHLGEIQLVDIEEQNILVNTWNDSYTSFPHEQCLHQLFEAQAQRVPENIAVTFDKMNLTYAELNQKANQVARYLRQLGIIEGGLVGMCVKPSIDMIVGLLGIVKAGAAYVPLDPALPKKRISFIVEDIKSRVILTQNDLIDCVNHCAAKIVCLDTEWPDIEQQQKINLDIPLTSDNLIYMIFTSGSTGNPKGVKTMHYNVAALICNTNHMHPDDSDVFAKVNNFAFDISTWEIWTPLTYGAKLVGMPEAIKFAPQKFATFILEQNITMLYLPTALFHSISAEFPSAFSSLKLLVVGGESLDSTRSKEVLVNNPPQGFINAYGPTEVTCNAAWFDVRKQLSNAARVPIGRPISNTQFYVLSNYQRLLPIGAKGELYVGGAGVSRGYHERPELTNKHFIYNPFYHDKKFPRLYRTGDIVRYLPDGNLDFLGRVDHQVKIRGFRIEIGEIEGALRGHESIREAIVMIREENMNKHLVAFIVFNNSQSSIGTVQAYLKERIPNYMVPSAIIALDALPLNTNGKVDHNKLKEIEIEIENTSKDRSYPRDELELRLLRIWETIIGFRNPSIHINFFDAGGDSLRAVQLLSAINKEFSKQLPLEFLYEDGTIESLAMQLRADEIRSSGSVLILLYKEDEQQTPLFLVHPLSGSAMCYNQLARSLQYPLYGLQSASLETNEKPLTSIEAIASCYVTALLKVQQSGPFLLGGWSFGGIVAFEMARQLESSGHIVKGIFLFDSVNPEIAHKTLDTSAVLKLCLEEITEQFGIKINLDLNPLNAERRDSEIIFQTVLQQIKLCGAYPPDFEIATLERMVEVCLANAKALDIYQSACPVQSDIVLIRAEDSSRVKNMLVDPSILLQPCLGWSSLTHGRISIQETRGNHMSMLFYPNVEFIAAHIQDCIKLFLGTAGDGFGHHLLSL